jgi:hypothetical protein
MCYKRRVPPRISHGSFRRDVPMLQLRNGKYLQEDNVDVIFLLVLSCPVLSCFVLFCLALFAKALPAKEKTRRGELEYVIYL